MELKFQINPELDIPIYRQIVDTIRFAARKGTIPPGQKLPTVQELSQSLSIARGTIKRAYDELEQMGLVEKVQGRGTFLRQESEPSGSRKERAMAAIDDLFRQLEDMGLSMSEIHIFVDLRLRQLAEQEAAVRVAVIGCCQETLSAMSEQLRHIPGVDLYSYLLDNIRQYPYKLEEEFDLIVTTALHASYVESILPVKRTIARVALQPSSVFLHELLRLKPGKRLGILGYSQQFVQMQLDTCRKFTEGVEIAQPLVFSPDADLSSCLSGKDAVLVPKGYAKYLGQDAVKSLEAFPGLIIESNYLMDEGSLLYLEAKIQRLLDKKRI